MSSKITKPQLLHELVVTLLRGWTKSEILAEIDAIGSNVPDGSGHRSSEIEKKAEEPRARTMINDLQLPTDRHEALLRIATAFDRSEILTTQSDIKRFLEQRNIQAKDMKTRNQAFRRMIPALMKMSDKGLQRLLTQTNFSGPAELSDISDAIKLAGSSFRD